MPRARVHIPTSAFAGMFFSLHDARGQGDVQQVVEGIAGTIGGGFGGKMPDQFDPPTSPNHRGHAHSASLIAALVALRPNLGDAVEFLRSCADDWDERASQFEAGSDDRLVCLGLALSFRALAGFLNGLYAGYLCHLGLDMFTPAGIPAI